MVTGGTIDALCDQIVAGAAEPGDVLVIFGATLIVWAVATSGSWRPGSSATRTRRQSGS